MLKAPSGTNLKRLYQYLWDKCPGCELEMSKIIFQHFKVGSMRCWFWKRKKMAAMLSRPVIYVRTRRNFNFFMPYVTFTLMFSTMFLCKCTEVLWLCKSKVFHNFLLRVWLFPKSMTQASNPPPPLQLVSFFVRDIEPLMNICGPLVWQGWNVVLYRNVTERGKISGCDYNWSQWPGSAESRL